MFAPLVKNFSMFYEQVSTCPRSVSQVDIVVGTPGRLDDLISTGKLDLSQVRFLVLDECVRRSTDKSCILFTSSVHSLPHILSSHICFQDGLLSAGYTDFIMRIYNKIPQVTSDGKRLQVPLRAVVYMLNKKTVYSRQNVNIFAFAVGDRVLGNPALVRREEALGEDHALSHVGGPER